MTSPQSHKGTKPVLFSQLRLAVGGRAAKGSSKSSRVHVEVFDPVVVLTGCSWPGPMDLLPVWVRGRAAAGAWLLLTLNEAWLIKAVRPPPQLHYGYNRWPFCPLCANTRAL